MKLSELTMLLESSREVVRNLVGSSTSRNLPEAVRIEVFQRNLHIMGESPSMSFRLMKLIDALEDAVRVVGDTDVRVVPEPVHDD